MMADLRTGFDFVAVIPEACEVLDITQYRDAIFVCTDVGVFQLVHDEDGVASFEKVQLS